jgi:hypothetical protein
MITSKAQAFAFLFLVMWTTSALSAGHGRHQTVTIVTDSSDTADETSSCLQSNHLLFLESILWGRLLVCVWDVGRGA